MNLSIKYRTCLITFILLISSLSVLIISPASVKADESTGEEVLYFKDYYLSGSEELTNFPEMSLVPPTKENDSAFPPSIRDTEMWLNWFALWITEKMAGFEDIEGLDVFSDFFNPFVMTESYLYEGDLNKQIAGDIRFDLYFSSTLPSKLLFKDEVKVAVCKNLEEINSTQVTIDPRLFNGLIQKQTVFIEGIDFELENGDEIEFKIEMLPGDKPIGSLIENRDLDTILEIADLIADALINQSYSDDLVEIGEILKEAINATTDPEVNLSLADIAELVNSVRSSSLIYDSVDHPSSVTIPVKLSEGDNIRTYYLRADGDLKVQRPTSEEGSEADLRETHSWTGPELERNKILSEASASLYLQYRDLIRLLNMDNATVVATLLYDEDVIANSQVKLEKNTILDALFKPIEPTVFKFNFDAKEIQNGEKIGLKIAVANGTKFGPLDLGLYRDIKLIYDSEKCPSHLTISFKETDNINLALESDEEQKIITGGSAEFLLNITSNTTDTVTIEHVILDKKGDWGFDYTKSIGVTPGSSTIIKVTVTHEDESLDAYGEHFANLKFIVSGLTGIDNKEATVEVSQDAVDYIIDIDAPSGKDVKHGEKVEYVFKVTNKNTGLWPDDYDIEVKSEHNWSLDVNYNKSEARKVDVDESFEVSVELKVPEYTDIDSDKLTFIVTSDEGGMSVTTNITTSVITPNILEQIYRFFESVAESLGLDDALGDYAALFLIFILLFIIFIFLVAIIFISRKKYVELICLDRVKEISPEEHAEFIITVKNPDKHKQTFDLNVDLKSSSDRWETALNTDKVTLDSKQSAPIKLVVAPTDFVKEGDWAEVKITAGRMGRKKRTVISTVTTIKNGKPRLKVTQVVHKPKTFKKGQRVETSFKVENRGKVAANNVSIILYLNGEEKNKVEDITIPSGGYAEVEMPWRAVKGKNDINIVVI
jgi:hypothetical protein